MTFTYTAYVNVIQIITKAIKNNNCYKSLIPHKFYASKLLH